MKKIWISIMAFLLAFSYINVVSAEEKPALKLASEAAILVDSKTGTVLYEKNSNQKMYPASLTKIATAIYAIENGKLDDIVTISKKAAETDGTKVYLVEGEKVTLKHLLQGLLINSGNDAGVAIAEHLSGSVDKFADDLNQYLVDKIGVSATNFVNPHGLFDPDHFTTAFDLAKITNYAIQNETFREIFGTKELKWDGQAWDTKLITHHLILKGEIEYKEVTGGKTGYVNESGQTLATTAKNDNIGLTVITLNSKTKKDAYSDTKKLLNYGFKYFETSNLPKDLTFNNGEDVFKVAQDLYFTKPIDTNIEEKVSKKGMLKIIDKSGFVLDSFQLPATKAKEPQTNKSKTKTSDQNSSWLLYIITLLISVAAIASIKKVISYKFRKGC